MALKAKTISYKKISNTQSSFQKQRLPPPLSLPLPKSNHTTNSHVSDNFVAKLISTTQNTFQNIGSYLHKEITNLFHTKNNTVTLPKPAEALKAAAPAAAPAAPTQISPFSNPIDWVINTPLGLLGAGKDMISDGIPATIKNLGLKPAEFMMNGVANLAGFNNPFNFSETATGYLKSALSLPFKPFESLFSKPTPPAAKPKN